MGELAKLKQKAKDYRILCVEDDVILRGQIVTFLKKLFKNTYSACDGEDGIKKFKQYLPDIVVSDLSMPNKNGFELIQEIQRLKPSAQVIIISAHNDSHTLLNAIHIGICDFVSKPIPMSGLQSALEKAIVALEDIHQKQIENLNNDIKEHQNDAINDLLRVKKSGNDIQLINHYRGVPIIHTGFIEKIEDEQLVIQTKYTQILAFKYEKHITITSELLAHDIKADYVTCDYFESIIVVNNVTYSPTSAKKRQQIRVEVDDKFEIILLNKTKKHVLARAIDISNKAIYVELIEPDYDISEGEQFDLEIKSYTGEIKAIAQVYKIIKEEIEPQIQHKSILKYRVFVVLFLKLDDENLEILQKYIYDRQLELLDEFRGSQL